MTDLFLAPELEEDSEDLTDEEVESAVPAKNADVIVKYLKDFRCRECRQNIEVREHSLRRRAPFFYARMVLGCEKDHKDKVVFRADWLSS